MKLIPLLVVLARLPVGQGVGCGAQDSLFCGATVVSGCYSRKQRCDGYKDCINGADEHACSGNHAAKITQNEPDVVSYPYSTLRPVHKLKLAPTKSPMSKNNSKNKQKTQTSLLNHNVETPQHQSLSHNANYAKYKGHNNGSQSRSQLDNSDKDIPAYPANNSRANLGWLITPIVFGIACLYVLYRCISDGLCKCRRFRRLSGQAISFMHLNGISFYGFSRTHLGGQSSQTDTSQAREQLVPENSVRLTIAGSATDTTNNSHSHTNGFIQVPQQEVPATVDPDVEMTTTACSKEKATKMS